MYRQGRMRTKLEGIVLARKNSGETDRIVTIFTKEQGIIRLLAKGVRKVSSRRSSHLEIFSHVEVLVYSSRGIDLLSEISPIEIYDSVRADLHRVSVAYFYCELILFLIPLHQENGEVFDQLVYYLRHLNQTNDPYAHAKQFPLMLVRSLGFLPRNQEIHGAELEAFIENITEKKLKTPRLIRKFLAR